MPPAPSDAKDLTSRQTKTQEDSRFRMMPTLQENSDLTQRELAAKLGVSVGGLNYCLNAPIAEGLVKMKNSANSKNRVRLRLSALPQRHS
jgi:DNA-binding transcriptional regulator LsrR (DeoR family)